MQWTRMIMMLAAACVAASQAGTAAAQQSPAGKPAPPQAQQAKEYYDMYEPVQRLRMRRETCGRKEQSIGAYCVKACRTGYAAVAGSIPPRCRSLTPLPAGQFPTGVRKEIDVQTRLPAPPPSKPENPKHGW